jgi:DNA invertase Pin-like site-specific DNA recombinase/uncharacterized protein YukE
MVINGNAYQGIAISYGRISTGKQIDGRGLGRQDDGAQRWCERNSYFLDTSFVDPGMSGFKGKNATIGKLGRLIELAEGGKWQPGTLLIVESLDRLSRQEIDDAQNLFRRILATGLNILTLMDGQLWTLERWRSDLTARIVSLVIMSRANEESETKSRRLKDVWSNRRDQRAAGKGKPSNACPAWMKAVDDVFHIPAARQAVIDRIKSDRCLGLGAHAIATRLNADKVPAFDGNNSKGVTGWHKSYVQKLVKNPALYGVYQPRNMTGEPVGESIEGYYPSAMSKEDWFRIQWPANERAPAGKADKVLNNLFAGLFKCHCGGTLVRDNKGSSGAYLVCGNSRRGLCADKSRYAIADLENEALQALTIFDVSGMIDRSNPHADKIASLSAEIAEKESIIEQMAEGFGGNAPAAFFKRMQAMQAEVDTAKAALAEAEIAAQIAKARENRDSYTAFVSMVDKLPKMAGEALFQCRQRIAQELGRMIASGTAKDGQLVVSLATDGMIAFDLAFNRTQLIELRATALNSGNLYTMGRDMALSGVDVAGLFAGYLGRGRATA